MVKKPRHPVGESLILSRLSGRRCGVGERFDRPWVIMPSGITPDASNLVLWS